MARQLGFFDLDHRYEALSASGDPLERCGRLVDVGFFLEPLAKALRRSDRSKGGRPPYDPVMMFKVLVLQALYNLSNDKAEFQIRDGLSFMRFQGLGLSDRTRDANTSWLFREQLVRARAVERLFDRFDRHLEAHGYLAMSSQIVDASIVQAPKQRNNDAERTAIKEGRVREGWEDKPAKLQQ